MSTDLRSNADATSKHHAFKTRRHGLYGVKRAFPGIPSNLSATPEVAVSMPYDGPTRFLGDWEAFFAKNNRNGDGAGYTGLGHRIGGDRDMGGRGKDCVI